MADKQDQPSAAPGLPVSVYRDVPDVTVEVAEGAGITHEGEHYNGGDQFTLSGPTALSLLQQGIVKFVGGD